jgi:hypothetical protein
MAYTYDLGSSEGQIRLLIMDNNAAAYVFEDAEISAFLTLESANVRKGAALALETLASNEAFVLKVIKLLDLQTDGAKTADALMKRAAALRKQAADDEQAEEGGAFDIAEMVVDDFSGRERISKEWLRGYG